MWSGCAGRLSAERNGIIFFLKIPSKLWLYKNNQEVEKYVIKCAKNTIKHGISYTGNDVIWSDLTISSELQACHGWCWLQVKSQCLGFGSLLSLSIFSLSKHHTDPVLHENFGIFFSWASELGWRLHTRTQWESLDLLLLPPCCQQAEFRLWRHSMVVLLCPLKNVLRAILYLQTTTWTD